MLAIIALAAALSCQPVTLDNADTIKGIEYDLDGMYRFRSVGKGQFSAWLRSADGHVYCPDQSGQDGVICTAPVVTQPSYSAYLGSADVRAITNYLIWRRMHDLAHYCVTYTPPKGEK